MSYEVIEYEVEDLHDEAVAIAEPPRPWVWAIVGALIGLAAGYISVTDLEAVTTPETSLPPLTLPREAAAEVDDDTGAVIPRRVVPGLDQTLWVLIDPANPRLLRWSPHLEAPSLDQRPVSTVTAVPDASGATFAEEVPLANGKMLVVTRAAGDFAENYTVPMSLNVDGWAWHQTEPRRLAWTEPGDGFTQVKWTSFFGPESGELTFEGEWKVAAYESRIVVQGEQSLLLIDPSGEQAIVERTVETAPIRVQGVVDGIAYAVHGPDSTQVAVELLLGNQDRVDWRRADAVTMAEAPRTGWGSLWFGPSVEVHAPDGAAFTHPASGQPFWSEEGRFLIFPNGASIVIFDTVARRFGELGLDQRVLAVWGS
ncbi:MAG: hypothetical protein JSV07_06840 [Acidimicrobiia bacterium]|nr:MAG: hypothetical protein JSV07_06840 [Acidimicrobiia bacterium]